MARPKKANNKDEEVDYSLALDTLFSAINKRFGENTIMFLGRDAQSSSRYESYSTGLFKLDNILGNHGFVRGRFIEVWGEESSGKTTLVLNEVANIQKAGGLVVYIDGEQTLDPFYASKIGVNIEDLIICQPKHGAEALNVIDALAQSGLVAAVVVDSVPSLIPEDMMNKEHGEATIGLLARLIGPGSKMLVPLCEKSKMNIYWINQVREVIDIGYGGNRGGKKLNRPGGREFRHNLSYSLFLKYIGEVKDGDQRIGHDIEVKVVKNKCAPPHKKEVLRVMYDEKRNLWGVNDSVDLYMTALDLGLINASGTKKTFMKKHELTKFGVGALNSIHHISADLELKELMRSTIREILNYPEPYIFNHEKVAPPKEVLKNIKVDRITDQLAKSNNINIPKEENSKNKSDEVDFMAQLQAAIAAKEMSSNEIEDEVVDLDAGTTEENNENIEEEKLEEKIETKDEDNKDILEEKEELEEVPKNEETKDTNNAFSVDDIDAFVDIEL